MDSEEDEVRIPRKNDYVSVVDTSDEWEDLIGKVEEFMDAEGATSPTYVDGMSVVVFFPTSTSEIRQHRMVGVNHFTAYVRYCLSEQSNKHVLPLKNVEWVDPQDL